MSTLAKRLVSPDLVCPDHWSGPDWVLTEGPLVADLCATAGFAPDPQQALGLDLIFAVGENGLPASFAFCVICCRQNLKTGLLKQAAIGWLFITEERRIVWSAHEMDTTRDAHRDLELLITETPALSRRLPKTDNRGIYGANGQERIELANGQILKFKARTLSGGRGLTGDKVILDEAFALKAAHVGALLPTMTARPSGQVLYASSAGKADSAILRDVRDRGRAGSSSRLSYIEWLAEREECSERGCHHPKNAASRGVDCALDREHLWRSANPTITTGRITLQTIADLRQELPPEEFSRECLGWWDVPGADETFGEGAWDDCAGGEPLGLAVSGLAIAAGLDLDKAAIVAAAVDDDQVHVKPLQHGPGTGWVVDRAKALQDRHNVDVVIDGRGPGAVLIPHLERAGVRLRVASTSEVLDACAGIYRLVQERRLRHAEYPELNEAVSGAVKRKVGDRWAWGRAASTSDITPLEGATLAAWAADSLEPAVSAYEGRGVLTI